MLRGLFIRSLPAVCALLLFAGCGDEGGELVEASGGPAEPVASVELGSHMAGAGGVGSGAECTTDADCGGDVGCGTCAGNGHCVYADTATTCGDPTDDDCKNPDHCDGAGACVANDEADGTGCGSSSDTECDNPDTCESGSCVDNYEPADTDCGDGNDDFCTDPDTCDGAGACLPNHENEGIVCDSDVGTCDPDDVCSNGVCPELHADTSTPCGSQSDDECSNPNRCDGAGSCSDMDEPAGVSCGDPTATDCNGADTCDGSGSCQDNLAGEGDPCGDQTNTICNGANTCDDSGVCQDNFAGTNVDCGDDSDTTCTNPDRCDGAGSCNLGHAVNGTSCGDSSNTECTDPDTCQNGLCVPNNAANGTLCGNQTDTECDNPNTCQSGACADNFVATGTSCGSNLDDDCTNPDTCDGAGACNARHAALDAPCGSSLDDACTDPDRCDGSGVCLPRHANAGTACGSSVNDECTDPDQCDGSGVCLPNHATAGTACGDQSDSDCTDPNQCDGSGTCLDRHAPAGDPCGSAVDTSCDDPDTCTGNGTCQANLAPNGTDCNDGIACTTDSSCQSGSCTHAPGDENDGLCTQTSCAVWVCDPANCAADPNCVPTVGCIATLNPSDTVCRTAAGVCDVAETCTGSSTACPADVTRPSTYVCQPPTCSAGVAVREAECGVSTSTCPVLAPESCGAYQCNAEGTACRTSCSTGAHCHPDYYCDGDQCLPRIDPGESCGSDDECSPSNPYCVDGVCCDARCEGQCESCNQAGSAGLCTPNPSGSQPVGDREDCAADGTSCDGFCDGVERTECVYPGDDTSCAEPSCDALTNQATDEAFCDGAGACAVPEPVDCSPYVCGATQCRGDCLADSDCDGAAYCRAGVCTPKLDDGDSCSRAAQCASGFCVDDVCCDARCEGQCEACNQAGSEGQCSAVTGSPVGDRPGCSGSGECAGSCDGSSRAACVYPGLEVQCRGPSCEGGVATLAAQCNGGGSCPAAQTIECEFDCEGAICAGDECTIDANCPQGEHCQAGVCVPTGGPGAQCSDAGDCASGFCVDGVCCESACLGQCEACDVSGSEGSCVPVPAGDAPHGGRAACAGDGSVCGGSCDGSTRDGCAYPVGDVCRPGSCEGGDSGAVAVVEATCQGDGRCPAEQRQSCGELACTSDGELCDGECAGGEACGAAEYCSAGVCVPRQPEGESCAGDDQCQSEVCVDGVCCNTECSGQCEACDVAGQVGTCVAVEGGTHGGRPACSGAGPCGARCDGSSRDECGFPAAGTSCGPAYCASGSRSDGQTCDGSGICTAGEMEACLSLACEGTECATGCETDADCTGENRCIDGVCEPSPLIDAVDEGSCGCRVPGGRAPSGAWLLLAGLLAAHTLRRRRAA